MNHTLDLALAELGGVVKEIDQATIDKACNMLTTAQNIVLYGCGREGLQMRGFAMRLYHLGLKSTMQGDMATPPVGKNDLLVVSDGPGLAWCGVGRLCKRLVQHPPRRIWH